MKILPNNARSKTKKALILYHEACKLTSVKKNNLYFMVLCLFISKLTSFRLKCSNMNATGSVN